MDWPVIASSAITGVVGISGALLGGHFTQRTEQRRVANEDARRWLADRRHAYAAYLAIVASMLRSIYDKVSVFDEKTIALDNKSMLKEYSITFYRRWTDEVLPALGEVQLAEFSLQSYHLLDATRNAMRTELGLTTPIKTTFSWYRDGPWLPDGPEDHGED
jgi:hypothetical protein